MPRLAYALLLVLPLALLSPSLARGEKPSRAEREKRPAAEQSSPSSAATVSFDLEDPGALAEGLQPWLGAFIEALALRDLEGAMRYFDPQNREEQAQIGLTCDAQYVIEGLGVARFTKIAGPDLPDQVNYPVLFRSIEHIEVRRVTTLDDAAGSPIEGFVEVHGEIRFGEGRRYRMILQLRRDSEGNWSVSPALG